MDGEYTIFLYLLNQWFTKKTTWYPRCRFEDDLGNQFYEILITDGSNIFSNNNRY